MVVGVLAILIKKTILFIAPPLLSFTICFIIGFTESKKCMLYPILGNYIPILLFVSDCLILIILIIVSRIIILKTKRKRLRYLSIVFLVVIYLCSFILSMILCCFDMYHDSQTNDLNNYLICDDVSISKEAKEYFPEKESFKNYNSSYSYYYSCFPVLDEDFDIQLIIDYQNDYEEIKETIKNKYLDIFENNQVEIKYKTYNDHYKKIIIKLDDDNRTVEYKFSDHILDE